jgi:hypothetical protein
MRMKPFYQICFIALWFLSLSGSASTQGFDSVYQLTDGNNDRNPKFNFSIKDFPLFSSQQEMLVFERLSSDSSVHIYAQKMDKNGIVDSPVLLTQVTAIPRKNINPTIAYNTGNTLGYIIVVWQTDQYGGSKLYGKKYIEGQGWSSEFPVDSTSTRSFNPNVVCLDSTNFAITYRKGNDIFFKKYNIITGNFSAEKNLTPGDTFHCSNPYVTLSTPMSLGYLIVTYEREINPNKHSICYQYRIANNDTANWSQQDSLSFTGDNRNAGFNEGNIATYETNSAGNWQIRGVRINPGGSNFHESLFTQTGGDYSNFQGKTFFITDGGGSYSAYGVMEDILSNWFFVRFYVFSSQLLDVEISELGDEIPHTMTSSGPIANANCRRFWFVFNSSLSPTSQFESRIFGTWVDNCLTGVYQLGNETPGSFSLFQNYPNPFNPATKIRFDIPLQTNVRLAIYNSLGQEVVQLVNEKLLPGSYEYSFDGSKLSSGIYFYSIETEGFWETKKMVLIK